MWFSPRIPTKQLAALCRRLAISLQSGIDLRTVWSQEAKRAISPIAQARFRLISDAVNEGETLYQAIKETDDYFPETFRSLAQVGEKTGHLAECFAQLAEHYEEQLKLRRILVTASTWPAIELGVALAVVGFLIWFMGTINRGGGPVIDPLGFGLVGNSGLAVYLTVLGLVGLGIFVVVHAIRRGLVWTRPIQRLILRVPVLGQALQHVALSRLAWALRLTLDSGMELRQAMRLSLRAARNAQYTDQIKPINTAIEEGNPIHEAFSETGAFPFHFVEAVRVGEESGRLVESMGLLSGQYREQAEASFNALTKVGGFGIWLLVAAIIIFFIFRLALFYIGTISNLT
jgi:type IV pilus assembly protein PilC